MSLNHLGAEELRALLQRAVELKRNPALAPSLPGRTLGLIFEKASTRTRVAFEVAMNQLGGGAVFLSGGDSQLGRGEPLEDSARVLSRMVDCIAVRTFQQSALERFAACSQVPVINALTDAYHPCQLLADMQTYMEQRGDIRGRSVAWVGDGNNVCRSYMNAARLLDFHLRIACPPGFEPDPALGEGQSKESQTKGISLVRDPVEAVTGADLVVTDVWASMGQEQEQVARHAAFKPYQVNGALMSHAAGDALFMHCLPAHRGEEVTVEVLEGRQSVVWDEAENRLHTQKALLELLLS